MIYLSIGPKVSLLRPNTFMTLICSHAYLLHLARATWSEPSQPNPSQHNPDHATSFLWWSSSSCLSPLILVFDYTNSQHKHNSIAQSLFIQVYIFNSQSTNPLHNKIASNRQRYKLPFYMRY